MNLDPCPGELELRLARGALAVADETVRRHVMDVARSRLGVPALRVALEQHRAARMRVRAALESMLAIPPPPLSSPENVR